MQGNAILIVQTIVLKYAFKFHQFGEYCVAVHVRNLDDSATGVAAHKAVPLTGSVGTPAPKKNDPAALAIVGSPRMLCRS